MIKTNKWIAAATAAVMTLAVLPSMGFARTHYTGSTPASLLSTSSSHRTTQLARHKKATTVKHKKHHKRKHHKKKA